MPVPNQFPFVLHFDKIFSLCRISKVCIGLIKKNQQALKRMNMNEIKGHETYNI